jgi:hypothetical protein
LQTLPIRAYTISNKKKLKFIYLKTKIVFK